jgi:hypothetical protein
LRKIVTNLVALAAGHVCSHPARAGAPMQKGQAPGFYRMKLGDFEVVALSDGTVNLEVRKLLTNTRRRRSTSS